MTRISDEQMVALASKNKGQCRSCSRVGPLNGAFTSWWNGCPVLVLCPDCFQPGRGIKITRTQSGMDLKMLDHDAAPEIMIVPSLSGLDALKAQRAPSKGWQG
jgi:hypothetical protein